MRHPKYAMVLLGLVVCGFSFFASPASADEQEAAAKKDFVEMLNLLVADGKLADAARDAASSKMFDKYVWKGHDPSTDINRYNAAMEEIRAGTKEGTVAIEVDEKSGKEYLVFQQADSRQRVCEVEFSTEPVENVFVQVLTVMANSLVDEDASDNRCVFAAAAAPAEAPSPPPASAGQREAGPKKEFVDVLNELIADGELGSAAINILFDKYITNGGGMANNDAYEAARDEFMVGTKGGTVSIEVDGKSGKKFLVFQQAESRQRVCEIEYSAEPVNNVFAQVLTVMANSLVDGDASDRRCVFDTAPAAGYADQATLLHAASVGDVTTIERLLNQGVAIDATDPATGQSPLHKAADGGKRSAVKLLIDHGANVNAVDADGETPLHKAIADRSAVVVRLLVAGGADVNARDSDGKTPVNSLLGHWKLADDRQEAAVAEELILYLSRHGVSLETELKSLLDQYSYEAKVIIKLASLMSPPPAVGEEARRAAIEGKTAFKRASNTAGFEKAKEHFEEAVKLAPWWPEAYFNLGLVLEKLREYDAAKDNFELYVYAAPGAADVAAVQEKIYELEYLQQRKVEAERWIDAGADYYNAGNVYEAVNAYKKAIELDPDDPIAHANLGDAYRRLERHKEAVVELREALRLGKKDAFVYAALGRAYKNLGEGKKAIDVMEEGVHELGEVGKFFDHRYGFLRQRLGRYYEEEGQYEKALANFEAALEFGKNDVDVDKDRMREKIDQLKRRVGRK